MLAGRDMLFPPVAYWGDPRESADAYGWPHGQQPYRSGWVGRDDLPPAPMTRPKDPS